jgi:hypothetical protein
MFVGWDSNLMTVGFEIGLGDVIRGRMQSRAGGGTRRRIPRAATIHLERS